MGLDMYLEKRNYVKQWKHNGDENVDVSVTRNGEPIQSIDPKKVTYVIEEVGYWRKANHIHKWFVDNVQEGEDDCGEYWVSKDSLSKLLDICKAVIEDNSKAQELLPTSSGFFFGGTEYDEYYFSDVSKTIRIIESVLSTINQDNINSSIYYSSSW